MTVKLDERTAIALQKQIAIMMAQNERLRTVALVAHQCLDQTEYRSWYEERIWRALQKLEPGDLAVEMPAGEADERQSP